jgi:hypothetical protein
MESNENPLANWEAILEMLPPDRCEKAHEYGLFQRTRQIKNCDDLLRLLCLYSWSDLSLMSCAAAANEAGIASVSDVALLKRFRQTCDWLLWMVETLLSERLPPPVPESLPYQIQVVDATALRLPGSHTTDYRLHARYCLLTKQWVGLEFTDVKGGESLTHYEPQEGDLYIADRAYGHRAGLAHLEAAGAKVLVRFGWSQLPMQNRDGTPFNLFAALSSLQEGQLGDWQVQTTPDPKTPAVMGRVIAIPRTPQETENAMRVAKRTASKQQRKLSPETLLCCGYFFVFTTLPNEQVDAPGVLALYRFRWQIELAFKSLKSQLHLDRIRAHQKQMVMPYLLCKLLGAILLQDLTQSWVSFSPGGP